MTDRSLPFAPEPLPDLPPGVPPPVRDLRLDLFRGLALWMIFIGHLPQNVLTWVTIRNYGFSDATEIFIFISGYTAALVYGRAMLERGFVVASGRILKRAWQIYVAHIFLFTIYLAQISYVASRFQNPLYVEEMGILDFLHSPDMTIVQALLLKFRPVNMDVLPLYIVLMLVFPLTLWLMIRRPNLTLAGSAVLYVLTLHFGWSLPSYPSGVWFFNPFAWQLLFVFGAWCALGGARRVASLARSKVTIAVCSAYLLFGFCVTLTWNFPQLGWHTPVWLEWIYPVSKTNLDILRFLHFVALATVTLRLVPIDWRGLRLPALRPLILCGQHSLEVFCIGVFLAFTGHFLMAEFSGGIVLHSLISVGGVVVMSAAAWILSWYKDVVGGGARTEAAKAGGAAKNDTDVTGGPS